MSQSNAYISEFSAVNSYYKVKLTCMLYFIPNQVCNYFLESLPSGLTNYAGDNNWEAVAQFRLCCLLNDTLQNEIDQLWTGSSSLVQGILTLSWNPGKSMTMLWICFTELSHSAACFNINYIFKNIDLSCLSWCFTPWWDFQCFDVCFEWGYPEL